MPLAQSPRQTVAEMVLGVPLESYVVEKRAAIPQWSWRLIAEQLAADTEQKVAVTGETLRQWFSEVAA